MSEMANKHFATLLSRHMAQQSLSIRELSKRLGISYEHARRLQTGEALPSPLLVEKMDSAIRLPHEEGQLAAQKDRMLKKYGEQLVAGRTGVSERVTLFEPLINALAPDQIPPAYAMLKGLVNAARSTQARLGVEHTGLPAKANKSKAAIELLGGHSGRKFRED
jgi:transcriptional regulator with XRE-family HTH domain